MLRVALAIRALGVFFLELRGVGEHDARELGRRRRAEDAAAEALRHEPRQVAAVIEVRVREHDRVDRVGADRQRLPVALAQLLQSLKQPAVDEHAMAVGVEQMLRTGDGARGAETGQSVMSFGSLQ